MKFLNAIAAVMAAAVTVAAQSQTSVNPQQPTQNPSGDLDLRTSTPLGCFSDPGDMWDMGPYTFQTNGWCQALCVRQSATYFALVNGTNCFCGDAQPESKYSVSSGECDTTCNGFDSQNCGGTNRWALYADNFRNGDETGTVHITTPTQTWFGHAATSATTLKTSTGPNTIIVTAAASIATADANTGGNASSGPSKGAIAGGTIAGVIGLGAIIGAVLYTLRVKKQRKIEEERRRHDSIMRIVNRGEKSGSFSGSDSRLEPNVMFQRRQSDGSIMDNQDYSRRILKVTNPDWRSSRA